MVEREVFVLSPSERKKRNKTTNGNAVENLLIKKESEKPYEL